MFLRDKAYIHIGKARIGELSYMLHYRVDV